MNDLEHWPFESEQTNERTNEPSACSGFDGVLVERGVVHRKVVGVRAEQLGKYGLAFVSVRVFVDVSVHETVHHGRMSVNVDEKVEFRVLLRGNKQQLTETGQAGECEWSRGLTGSLASLRTCDLAAKSSGWAHGEGSCQTRFRSKPMSEHLQANEA